MSPCTSAKPAQASAEEAGAPWELQSGVKVVFCGLSGPVSRASCRWSMVLVDGCLAGCGGLVSVATPLGGAKGGVT